MTCADGQPCASMSASVSSALLDAQAGPEWLAAAQTAIVKRQASNMRGEDVDLGSPSPSLNAYALNENRGRAASLNIISELAAAVKKHQVIEYPTVPVANIYLLETVPLDGCLQIGHNDVGLFRSEIGI
jgi:hypothetical protein